MKTIKVFTLLLSVVLTTNFYAQNVPNKSTDMEVKEIGVTVNSLEELDNLNWKEYFSVFDKNKEESEIRVFLKIENLLVGEHSLHRNTEQKLEKLQVLEKAIQKVKKVFDENELLKNEIDSSDMDNENITSIQNLIESSEIVIEVFSKNKILINTMEFEVVGLRNEKEELIKKMIKSTERAKNIICRMQEKI